MKNISWYLIVLLALNISLRGMNKKKINPPPSPVQLSNPYRSPNRNTTNFAWCEAVGATRDSSPDNNPNKQAPKDTTPPPSPKNKNT